jgi:hypothetical protein
MQSSTSISTLTRGHASLLSGLNVGNGLLTMTSSNLGVNQVAPRGKLHVGGDAVIDGCIEIFGSGGGIHFNATSGTLNTDTSTQREARTTRQQMQAEMQAHLSNMMIDLHDTLYESIYSKLSAQFEQERQERVPPAVKKDHQCSQQQQQQFVDDLRTSLENEIHALLQKHQLEMSTTYLPVHEADNRFVTQDMLRAQNYVSLNRALGLFSRK